METEKKEQATQATTTQPATPIGGGADAQEQGTAPQPTPQQAREIEHAGNLAMFVPYLLDPRTLPAKVQRLEIKRLQSGWLRLFVAMDQPVPVDTMAELRDSVAANGCTLNTFVKGARCSTFQICDDLEP